MLRNSARRLLLLGPLSVFTLSIHAQPATSPVTTNCPVYLTVPGYGACVSFTTGRCGFCGYKCNGDTIVRWNLCS